MNLEQKIMVEMKDAMKSKNEAALRGLRAIKAEIIKAKTEPGAGGEISEDKELAMLQKMMKQRKDPLEIYQQQGRPDLAQKEQEEIAIIEKIFTTAIKLRRIKSRIETDHFRNRRSVTGGYGKSYGCRLKKTGGSC